MRKAICMIAVGAIAVGLFAGRAGSQSKTASGFDRLKTLVGEWQGTSPKGEVFTSTIRPVSNGTALEETFQNSEDNQMVTLYTPDGDRLLITHYCSTGNQPRMETVPVKAGQKGFAFSFVGVSNLKSPATGHMQNMTLQIVDDDHFTEQWTWRENGKDMTETFRFARKK